MAQELSLTLELLRGRAASPAGPRVDGLPRPLAREFAVVAALATPARHVGQEPEPRAEFGVGELADARALHQPQVDADEAPATERRAQESRFLVPARPLPRCSLTTRRPCRSGRPARARILTTRSTRHQGTSRAGRSRSTVPRQGGAFSARHEREHHTLQLRNSGESCLRFTPRRVTLSTKFVGLKGRSPSASGSPWRRKIQAESCFACEDDPR